jgi:hypothetical protein
MLQSASEGKASVRALGRVLFGPVNCLLVMALFALKHYFQIHDGWLLQGLGLFFPVEALLLVVTPFLTSREGSIPGRRSLWFLIPLLALVLGLLIHALRWSRNQAVSVEPRSRGSDVGGSRCSWREGSS